MSPVLPFLSVHRPRPLLLALALLSSVAAAEPTVTSLEQLQEQNRLLRSQLETQQHQIDELRDQMKQLAERHDAASSNDSKSQENSSGDRRLILSGEVDMVFFSQGRDGQYRNDEFRVDDADFRFEAPLAHDIFFYAELQIAKREVADDNFHLGEMYLEYENISGALGAPDRLVNLRFGRVNIPFGEEYQVRNSLEDPLVTHSVTDFWGTDEGIELYGEYGRASYAAALQNGSSKISRDFNADKALTLRIGYDITPRVRVSGSAMRTGKLSSLNENSELWIANGVFRNVDGSTVHQADLGEIDASYRWNGGHILGAIGRARYEDNSNLTGSTIHFRYYQIEAVQSITHDFYAALRFSSLSADGAGYPLPGIGNFVKYYLTALRTKDLQRMSIGAGYRFNPSLLLKAEYTFEDGELTTGASRDNHLVSFESALGF
ncbi:MAG TPA: hypothetical protein VIM69_09825 [Opitutaceae bacterium]